MPFGLYLGAHAQPVEDLCLHFVLTWTWHKFLLFGVSFCKAHQFALWHLVLSVAQLGLAPGGMCVVISLSWLCFVLYYLVQALIC